MGLKNLFFQEVDQPEDYTIYDSLDVKQQPEDVADVEVKDYSTLVDDIYAQNDLLDKSKSIYKVDELIGTLPSTLPTEAKKQSVIAILGSFGLDVTSVSEDGEKRSGVLSASLAKLTDENNKEVTDAEAKIEELKVEIQNLEKKIANDNDETKKCTDIINAEIGKIHDLEAFVNVEDANGTK